MPLLAVSTLGADRPGIIAAVSAVLLRAGCNIEESAMMRLRGEFAMMLVLDSPLAPEQLRGELRDVADTLGLVVNVQPAAEPADDDTTARRFTVSVYGADHPGIVHAVTSLLASRRVNVVDVVTHVLDREGIAVYVMVLEVSVPADADAVELTEALSGLAASAGVEASISAVDAEML
jgi:glycine cleavage system transcriptional repressor